MPAPVPPRRSSESAFSRAERLTRGEACALLGIPKTTLRRAEGTILPAVQEGGVWYHDRATVEACAREGLLGRPRERDRTAVAWQWFERGCTEVDVVRVLRCTAGEAAELHAQWLRARGGQATLPAAAQARLADAGIEVSTIDQLVELAIAAMQARSR